MRNTNKKGFTIVELVVVVAVIAILAAVLIPTFSGVIAKANLSADQAAVRQMNETLAIAEATDSDVKLQTIKKVLADNGYATDLDPVSAGYNFGWIAEEKVIVLVDKDNKVVFPEKYENYDSSKVELFNVLKVSSSSDILDLANGNLSEINGLNSIVLEENVNVLDSVSAATKNYLVFDNAGDVEIDGNGKTLEANINVTNSTSLTLNNVTIDATNSGSKGNSAVKPLSGTMYMTDVTLIGTEFAFAQNASQINGNVNVVAKNCTFDAAVAAYITAGNWNFENCTFKGTVTVAGGNVTFKNCKFNVSYTNSAKVDWPDETNNPAASYGAVYSEVNAIAIVDGRNLADYENGTVTFTNCTVNNAASATAKYLDLTYTHANPNTLTVVGLSN